LDIFHGKLLGFAFGAWKISCGKINPQGPDFFEKYLLQTSFELIFSFFWLIFNAPIQLRD